MKLSNLKISDKCIVKSVRSSDNIKRRLLDIGLTPGTMVEVVLENPGRNLKAYMIRGSLIAIRNSDSKDVLVDII